MKNSLQSACSKRGNVTCCKEKQILICLPCKEVWKARERCPSLIYSEIISGEFGVLIVSGLPLTLRAACNEDLQKILSVVAMKNYSDTCGALVYDAESERIWYRMLHASGDEKPLQNAIIAAEINRAAAALADAYETVLRIQKTGSIGLSAPG